MIPKQKAACDALAHASQAQRWSKHRVIDGSAKTTSRLGPSAQGYRAEQWWTSLWILHKNRTWHCKSHKPLYQQLVPRLKKKKKIHKNKGQPILIKNLEDTLSDSLIEKDIVDV